MANTIARRDGAGALSVASATANAHAATLSQVNAVVTPGSWTAPTLAAPWTSYLGAGPSVGGGPYETFSYRTEPGKRVFLRGWLTNSTAVTAGAAILSTALPVALRPTKAVTLFTPAENSSGTSQPPLRFELYTDGKIYAVRAIGINAFINFDNINFYIP